MNKNQDQLDNRRQYILERVKGKAPGEGTLSLVRQIAAELFVSESTIWKDLKRAESKKSDKRY